MESTVRMGGVREHEKDESIDRYDSVWDHPNSLFWWDCHRAFENSDYCDIIGENFGTVFGKIRRGIKR